MIDKNIFKEKLSIINIGAPNFKDDIEQQGEKVVQLQWKPPVDGEEEFVEYLDSYLDNDRIKNANEEAISEIMSSMPTLLDIRKAVEVIPDMDENTILHSGPPIEWKDMCGPMQGAIIGALIYENKAKNEEEARQLAKSGKIRFSPCHEHSTVGPMAGVVSPSMPVHIVLNRKNGNKAYCTVNEGLGKVLRFGAYDDSVLERIRWIEKVFAPVMSDALKLSAGIDLKVLIAQALQMGDECHNRNKAATSLFFRTITPFILKTKYPESVKEEVLGFINGNDHYFLNLSMPACKCSLDSARNIPYSTIVVAMARNGVDFGIQVSGLGNQWFTAPAEFIQGLYFPGYSENDATRDLGDSAITETMGIGGFAMGASPAITQFVGGDVEDAINNTINMYEITTEENSSFSLPTLNFRGTPTGINILKIFETGILPVINTGIAHKTAGIGQIGAGIVSPPKLCFVKALKKYREKYGDIQ